MASRGRLSSFSILIPWKDFMVLTLWNSGSLKSKTDSKTGLAFLTVILKGLYPLTAVFVLASITISTSELLPGQVGQFKTVLLFYVWFLRKLYKFKCEAVSTGISISSDLISFSSARWNNVHVHITCTLKPMFVSLDFVKLAGLRLQRKIDELLCRFFWFVSQQRRWTDWVPLWVIHLLVKSTWSTPLQKEASVFIFQCVLNS